MRDELGGSTMARRGGTPLHTTFDRGRPSLPGMGAQAEDGLVDSRAMLIEAAVALFGPMPDAAPVALITRLTGACDSSKAECRALVAVGCAATCCDGATTADAA
jgi:hypothetical protein